MRTSGINRIQQVFPQSAFNAANEHCERSCQNLARVHVWYAAEARALDSNTFANVEQGEVQNSLRGFSSKYNPEACYGSAAIVRQAL